MSLSLERARELRFKACLQYECRLNGVTAREVLSDSQREPLPSIRLRIFVRLRKVPARPGCGSSRSLFPMTWLAERLGRDHTTFLKSARTEDRQTLVDGSKRRASIMLGSIPAQQGGGQEQQARLASRCFAKFRTGMNTDEIGQFFHISEHQAHRMVREARGW